MTAPWVSYYTEPRNKRALFFLPGYTNGLSTQLIENLISLYADRKTCDVFGLEMQYEEDTPDVFDQSQERIRSAVRKFSAVHPDKEIVVVAKSLSGALCLYNLNELNIGGLVVLGFPVVLGWPPRISLLSLSTFPTPDYRSEWSPVLRRVSTPARIVNGDSDDLTDNEFLKEISDKNTHVRLSVLKDADHSLINTKTAEVCVGECAKEIDYFL